MSENKSCYWCGQDHKPEECPIAREEKLRRCYQAIASPLIEGDYIGPLRGEVNVCLNVIHYLKAFEEATKKTVTPEAYREIQNLAYKIRKEKYGSLLW
jgi:hypothetical protein